MNVVKMANRLQTWESLCESRLKISEKGIHNVETFSQARKLVMHYGLWKIHAELGEDGHVADGRLTSEQHFPQFGLTLS